MKKNKKGFAISTILYGLIFLSVAIFYMIITVVGDKRDRNDDFVNDIRNEIGEFE